MQKLFRRSPGEPISLPTTRNGLPTSQMSASCKGWTPTLLLIILLHIAEALRSKGWTPSKLFQPLTCISVPKIWSCCLSASCPGQATGQGSLDPTSQIGIFLNQRNRSLYIETGETRRKLKRSHLTLLDLPRASATCEWLRPTSIGSTIKQ